MYRIDNSTAIAVKPAKETAGSQGYWTKGDPAQGIPATVMDQDWLNMVQDELKNVIEAGGLTPDKDDDGQMAQAIQALILANSGGSSSSEPIYQPAHGFSKFDAVLHNGTIFAGAQADAIGNSSVVGIVGEVADVDNFTIYYGGILEWDDPLTPDYTVGNDIWLSTTTSKAIVDVEPTYNVGEVRQYIGEALPSGLLVNIDIGEEIDNRGLLEKASTLEAQEGTNDEKYMTSLKTREAFNATGSAPVFACRAWVNFDGTGAVTIRDSGNISSISDDAVGRYTVNFVTPMEGSDYCAVTNANNINPPSTHPLSAVDDPQVSSFKLITRDDLAYADRELVNVVVIT